MFVSLLSEVRNCEHDWLMPVGIKEEEAVALDALADVAEAEVLVVDWAAHPCHDRPRTALRSATEVKRIVEDGQEQLCRCMCVRGCVRSDARYGWIDAVGCACWCS